MPAPACCRIGHRAIVFGDAIHWALVAACLLAAFAQITLWRATMPSDNW